MCGTTNGSFGCTRERERESGSYRFASGGDLSVGIADLVTFVQDEVVPLVGDESVVMDEDVRVGRDENAGGGGAHLLDQSGAFLALEGATLVQDGHAKFWPPLVKFIHPLVKQRRWTDDENGAETAVTNRTTRPV